MDADIETQNNDLNRHDTHEEKAHVADSEWANLRRVPDKLPKIALLILAVEVSLHIPCNDMSLTPNLAR
jgi:POT family proton-dependent oligopeptide transporter